MEFTNLADETVGMEHEWSTESIEDYCKSKPPLLDLSSTPARHDSGERYFG
jgi:hypothetical protein